MTIEPFQLASPADSGKPLMSHRAAFSLFALASVVGLFSARPAPGQPKVPPPPASYDIDVRYRIVAGRNERARAFLALLRDLKALGFKRDADDEATGDDLNEIENVAVTHIKGTIPSANARKVPRNPSVRTILLTPAGVKLPAGPVRVDLDLAANLTPAAQRQLAGELVAVLRGFGFREAVGYDHRGFTRLLGSLPGDQIPTLLNDVRLTPVAWKLLPPTLLTDLRRFEGGSLVLRATLLEWSQHPAGKGLIADMLADWGIQKPALDYLARLPRQVRRNEDVVQELLLVQVQQHPEGAPFLAKLWAAVLKSKAARELVEELLTRLEGRVASAALPRLFRGSTVLRVIEARPDYPLPSPRPPLPEVPLAQQKLTSALRALLADAAVRRLEVILTTTPPEGSHEWERELHRVVPTLVIEGRVGEVVSVRCKAADALKLAVLQDVSTVRLPPPAESAVLILPDEQGDSAKVLAAAGLDRLHRLGRRGQGVRVAVVDGDFRGWDALVGKQLPKSTRYLDLTAERNDSLQPDPFPAGEGPGSGVRMALAVLLAAPDCELTLVRVDPAAPYMLGVVMRRLNGAVAVSESLARRRDDLAHQLRVLNNRRAALNKEREAVFRLFADNRPQNDPFLRKRQERRDAYFKAQEQFDQEQRQYDALVKRYLDYRAALRELRSVRVAVCGFNWNDGLPADGTGPLARYVDDSPLRVLWFQPSGNTRGQAWTGLFRDVNGDGVMEFADPKTPLPQGNWDHEVNFLGWQPLAGKRTRLLPAGTRVRVSLQWHEAHAAEYARPGEDPYRPPLTDLRLVVLAQPDPEGLKRPAEDLMIVAESVGLPQRIHNEPGGATYEQAVEFTADGKSGYGLRVEGVLPEGTEPRGVPMLPAARRTGEIRPRLFVQSVGGAGRAVLYSYATDAGTLGTPGDALRALTVGAVGAFGQVQAYATVGPPYNAELATKPDGYFMDRLGLAGLKNVGGTGMSAAFAAGRTAVLLSGGGLSPEQARCEFRERARRMSRIPRGD
jgi:hypothetical protein